MTKKINFKSELEDENKRLDQYLNEKMEGYSRAYIQNLIKDGLIEIKGIKKIKSSYKLKGNEDIQVNIPENEELEIVAEDIPLNIIYQDKDIAVINKTANMVVHPAPGNYSGTLVNAIMHHIKDLSGINGVLRPGIVHRLDKNTSGLIIVAKNDLAHRELTEMFKEKTIKKTYIAIVNGKLKKEKGRIETLVGRNPKDRKKMAVVYRNGKNAITNYWVLDEKDGYSLVKVQIETGRTHQIRVHMKSLGHSILGDDVYGKTSKIAARQMLHAYKLEFMHPVTKKEMKLTGEIPEDFKDVLEQLGLELKNI
ncbi:RluA family pseudouridine synthase [Haliovirga abyssi]|uniref:Pseudouridine synthase n=1 Tax=Haliovirga abyssi TaxID=2996794 RepID=A0AAU9D904_9FUSO|nr:RluA family pseudouridine synthase [Haliovirga abyssi]BDU51093.1 pseudouridine synthase [Haliovirga abyssi]